MNQPAAPPAVPTTVNAVTLAGRVSSEPEERELPSGDRILSFRVVVPREEDRRRASRQSVDVIECVAWTSRLRTSAARLRAGDEVEVTGALRRRFARSGGALASYVSVELATCRTVRKGRR